MRGAEVWLYPTVDELARKEFDLDSILSGESSFLFLWNNAGIRQRFQEKRMNRLASKISTVT